MPLYFKKLLKPEEVEALVDFLKTLKGQTIDPAHGRRNVKR